jgi:hypothetical protein
MLVRNHAAGRIAFLIFTVVLGALYVSPALLCQTRLPAPVLRGSPPTLRQLIRPSGYIFIGTVLAAEPVTSNPTELASMRITFRVEQSIRGVRPGQILTIRQWAGSWDGGARYRPGEHLLLFLYPPSKLGLTSTVGGRFGRFAMDWQGQTVANQARAAALTADRSRPSWVIRGQTRVENRDFMRALTRAARE